MPKPPLPEDPIKAFIKLFETTARYRHRHDVFRDFVFCSAVALSNQGGRYSQARETEYLETIKRYEPADRAAFQRLFSLLVIALDPAPRDVLGPIFMGLNLGDAFRGQFFTPFEVSKLMAEMLFGPETEQKLRQGEPITLSEPAVGSGGMVLAVAACLINRGHDPARSLRAHVVDIDRTAALMCFIQLSLWNIPAQVVVGNTITLEEREAWETPAWIHPALRAGRTEPAQSGPAAPSRKRAV